MRARFLAGFGAAVLALAAAPASAADFSFSGALANPGDVQLFTFAVGAESNVTLRTYSYAGGTNAAGQAIASGGFDPILSLYDQADMFVTANDDGGLNVPADPNTGQRYDTFIQRLLGPGNYTVAISVFPSFPNGNLAAGFQGATTFNGRTNAWAFDVLNVDRAIVNGAVPEPGTWAMMLFGFGAIGTALRGRRRRLGALANA